MTQRWNFSQIEREELRKRLGVLLVGPTFDSTKSILEQVREQLGGPLIIGQRLQALGFLAGSNPAPQEKLREEPEWAKMPEDFAGGLEEWLKLPDSEKKRIYEELSRGRRIYVSVWQEPSKRAMLDSDILLGHKLRQILSGSSRA
ncbi:MAG: hypothetical protein QXK47_04880 [Candidatus Bathyarchaeia archaeon]